jgi:hypothetical protein
MLALWNGGDADAIEEIYAPEFVDETREELVQLRGAFPDQRFEIERELHADGAVVLCLRWHGTHLGMFVSPLGRSRRRDAASRPAASRSSTSGTIASSASGRPGTSRAWWPSSARAVGRC